MAVLITTLILLEKKYKLMWNFYKTHRTLKIAIGLIIYMILQGLLMQEESSHEIYTYITDVMWVFAYFNIMLIIRMTIKKKKFK